MLLCGVGVALSGCGAQDRLASQNGPVDRFNQRLGVSSSPRMVEEGQPVPRGGGVYRVGRPYMVAGRRYVPSERPEGHAETGMASWYGRQFHGRLTANGEVYDMHALSAAHRTFPMPSYARVTNTRNGHSVIVRINDRGPFHANRVIDISSRTAHLLDFRGHGVARVKVEYVGRAPLEGSDDRMLLATLRTDGSPAPRPAGGASATMIASAEPRFVPQAPAQPAVVEAAQPVTQLSGGMPLPPERPFDLGLATPSNQTIATRQPGPAQVQTTQVAVSQPAPAPTTRQSGTTTVTVTASPAPAAMPQPAAPSLASASSRPVTLPTSTAYAPAPAQAPAIAAMPGAPAPRAAFGAGSLY